MTITTAAAASTQTSLPLVDLISSIPIDSAIFTTCTLSLAWFEGHLLRSLERCGANRIVLLADPAVRPHHRT